MDPAIGSGEVVTDPRPIWGHTSAAAEVTATKLAPLRPADAAAAKSGDDAATVAAITSPDAGQLAGDEPLVEPARSLERPAAEGIDGAAELHEMTQDDSDHAVVMAPLANGTVRPVDQGDLSSGGAAAREAATIRSPRGGSVEPADHELGQQDGMSESMRRAGPGTALTERVTRWRWTLHQIGLDVMRTDRVLEFYEVAEHRARLWDILAVYSWLDPEIGYCQGMSDLLSPLLIVFRNREEADAFWCFEFLMRRQRENFKGDRRGLGVQCQLDGVGRVISALNPKLHNHLAELGGSSYFFIFRMLMVRFRREFSFADILYLWEMLWALEYDSQEAARQAYIERVPLERRPKSSGRLLTSAAIASPPTTATDAATLRSARILGKYRQQQLLLGGGAAAQQLGSKEARAQELVVFCVAALVLRAGSLLGKAAGLDEVVKQVNDMTGHLDVKLLCKRALATHKRYLYKVLQVASHFKE
eukprot:SM000076S21870  [mRNA]  locus=s76:522114:524355:- [translate_table: standard]